MAATEHPTGIPESCPHCGASLSPWEQVLLGVDHALVCRHCWYRIILDVFEPGDQGDGKNPQQPSKD